MARQSPPWVLRTIPYAYSVFAAESVDVTVGPTFSADVTGLIPDEQCVEFWGNVWAGLGDLLDARLEARLREQLGDVETSLGPVRREAEAALTARFETCSNAQSRGARARASATAR